MIPPKARRRPAQSADESTRAPLGSARLRTARDVAYGWIRENAAQAAWVGLFGTLAFALAISVVLPGSIGEGSGLARWILVVSLVLAAAAGRIAQRGARDTRSQLAAHIAAEPAAADERVWLQLATESANLALWNSDLRTLNLRFSRGWESVLGRKSGEIALAELWDLVHPDDRDKSRAAILEHLQRRTDAYEIEQRMLHTDGSYHWVLSRGVAELDAAGRPVRLIGADVEITAHKRAEEMLRASDSRYRTLFESMDAAVMLMEGDRCIDCNPAVLRLFGLESRDQIIGKTPLDFAPPSQPDGTDSAEVVRRHLESGLEGGTRLFEWQAIRSNGEAFLMEVRFTPFEIDGKLFFQCIALDISRQRALEGALRESRESFRQLVEEINDVIYAVDDSGMVTYMSPVAERIFGTAPQDVAQRHFSEFLLPDDLPEVADWFREALAGQPEPHDHRIVTVSGDIRWVRNHSRCIRKNDRITGLRGVLSDITESKRLQQTLVALNESLERRVAERTQNLAAAVDQLRLQGAALESAADSILITDSDGRIIWVNPAFTQATGYNFTEALGQTLRSLTSEVHDDVLFSELWRKIQSGEVYRGEIVQRRKDGGCFTAEIVIAPVRDASGNVTHFVETQQDVTARREAENRVRRSETQLQAIVAAEPECVKVVAADGTLVDMNPAGLAMIEADSLEQVRGQPVDSLVVEGYRHAFQSLTKQALAGGEGTLEFEIVGLKGTRRWLDSHVVPLPAGPGRPAMALGITRDITRRKEAESRTAALLQISSEIAGTLDRSTLLASVQRRVAGALPCDAVVTFLLHPAREALRVASHHGIPSDLLPSLLALEFRMDGRFGEEVARGAPLVVNDVGESELLAELASDLPIGPVAAIRLSVHGQYFGRLCALRAPGRAGFTPAEVEVLGGIGRQLAIGLRAVELYETQRIEAEVSGGLAHLGQELIANLNAPELLDRLCHLTTDILHCDGSATLFRDPERREWTTVATSGHGDELWQSIRAITMAELPSSPVTQELQRTGILQLDGDGFARLATPASALALEAKVSRAVLVALRRGAEVTGAQVAVWYGPKEGLDPGEERLARGIGQMASIALDHSRVIRELESANRLKSDFMATMSHELRTPLNIIIGYGDLLLENALGPLGVEQAEALRRSRKSAAELLELVNATLDVGRLESGQSPLNLEEIDVADLLRALEAEIGDRYCESEVALVWEAPRRGLRVRSDVAKLKMILRNLIFNAMKFTTEGRVVVSADRVAGGLSLAVADTGIGIPAHLTSTIFEPFRQGDRSSTTRKHDGVGLGLYIVRRLADLLGATVTVESEERRGSVFRVWMPPKLVLSDPCLPRTSESRAQMH